MRTATSTLLVFLVTACHPSPPVRSPSEPRVVTARHDPSLRAEVVRCEPLVYSDEAPPELDRPAHVRAASGLGRLRSGWVIAQDDARFLAIRSDDGPVTALALPAAADGRRQFSEALGNKALKLDLEAIAALPDGRLVALGSGSTQRRERLVVVDADGSAAAVRDGSPLYAALRAARAFSGSELNVEGAVTTDGVLRLFQRGNGAVVDGVVPVSATADVPLEPFVRWLDGAASLPPLERVTQYDLGAVIRGDDGVPFGFTDAAALPGGVLFAAGAEDSPDTYADGDVLGARLGVIDEAGARYTTLLGDDGAPTLLKVEGIAADPGGLPRAWAVTDVDDPDRPALFCELSLTGPW